MSRSLAAVLALVLIGDIFVVMAAVVQYRSDEARLGSRSHAGVSVTVEPALAPRPTAAMWSGFRENRDLSGT